MTKKDAYYFSHDANARNDIKILSMRCDYGLEGYGMYWIIVETLREEKDYKIKFNDSNCRALAMQMHSKPEKVHEFISDCIDAYELFVSDGECFWSESLMRRMEKLEETRQKRKEAAAKRWGKTEENASGMQMHSKSNASAMQDSAKESKVDKTKRNNYTADFEKFWDVYPTKRTNNKKTAFKNWNTRLKDGFTAEQMIRGAQQYAEEQSETEEKYIKLAQTFLGPDEHFMLYQDKPKPKKSYTDAVTEERKKTPEHKAIEKKIWDKKWDEVYREKEERERTGRQYSRFK